MIIPTFWVRLHGPQESVALNHPREAAADEDLVGLENAVFIVAGKHPALEFTAGWQQGKDFLPASWDGIHIPGEDGRKKC